MTKACDPGGLLQSRETGKPRRELARLGAGGSAGEGAALFLSKENPPQRHPCQQPLQRPEFSQHPRQPFSRVFLNLWFAKPMVWVRVALHENDGNHENDENDEDDSDSYKQGVECWIRGNHGNHENDENHENPGCKPRVPQTIGLETPDFLGVPNCQENGKGGLSLRGVAFMTVLAVLTGEHLALLSLVLQNTGQRGNRDGFGGCGGFGRDGYPP